jgi:hypothetical protein
LFERVRDLGSVHAVTSADGHDAGLVVGHAEAHAAPQLSKDMQAALLRTVMWSERVSSDEPSHRACRYGKRR